MENSDFAKVLFGGDLLGEVKTQIKSSIKVDFVNQFTLFSVIGLLSVVSPELITSIANKAFENVKAKYTKELTGLSDIVANTHFAGMDDDDWGAVFAETQAETMALFEKIQALIVAHIAEVQ